MSTLPLGGNKDSDKADVEGKAALKLRRRSDLSKRKISYLQEILSGDPQDYDDHYFACAIGHFKAVSTELRTNFDDRFVAYWKAYIERVKRRFSQIDGETIANIFDENQAFHRRILMRDALDILSQKSDKSDLARIRKAIDDDVVDPSPQEIRFLGRMGGWEDIPRIAKMISSAKFGLLGTSAIKRHHALPVAAEEVLKLGRGRVAELLSLSLSPELQALIIAKLPMVSFRSLGEEIITEFLSDTSAKVRKAASLQILDSLTVKEAKSYLSGQFIPGRYRYYNVSLWLDLCEAFDKTKYQPVVREELRKVRGE